MVGSVAVGTAVGSWARCICLLQDTSAKRDMPSMAQPTVRALALRLTASRPQAGMPLQIWRSAGQPQGWGTLHIQAGSDRRSFVQSPLGKLAKPAAHPELLLSWAVPWRESRIASGAIWTAVLWRAPRAS